MVKAVGLLLLLLLLLLLWRLHAEGLARTAACALQGTTTNNVQEAHRKKWAKNVVLVRNVRVLVRAQHCTTGRGKHTLINPFRTRA